MNIRYYFILASIFFLFTHSLASEINSYYTTDFNRGDVITVLITEVDESYTLTLVNTADKYITGNIFFPLDTTCFKGQAALVGLGSTIKAGEYRLLIKNSDGIIEDSGKIIINENIFKKESIKLDDANSSLKTDLNPQIVSEALQIQKIYGTSSLASVTGIKKIKIPVENGKITSWYGNRREFLYSNGGSSKSTHTGVDIAAPLGIDIISGSSGKVVFSGKRIITGNTVVVEYLPGVYGAFFHINELFVKLDDKVTMDTVIGTVGSTGLATGPHLHWELRVGGVSVNPYYTLENGLIDNSLIMSIVSNQTADIQEGGDSP